MTEDLKKFEYPVTIDAGTVEEQAFKLAALAGGLEKLIWHCEPLNEASGGEAGPILELISVIRQKLDILGDQVST